MEYAIPRNLAAQGRDDWLASLPASIESIKQLWSLQIGAPFEPGGSTAWVAPALSAAHGETVLKVVLRHYEAEDEHAGLAAWNGRGSVYLYESAIIDASTAALLIERCVPGTHLALMPEEEQDLVIAGLLRQMWTASTDDHPFRPLSSMCDAWAEEFEGKVASGQARVDAGMVREAMELFRTLPRTAQRNVLLCTDLHAANVLASERQRWLAIDPKPYVGDPTYDVLQHMFNCEERLRTDPRGLASTLAGLLDLDPERLLLWLFARCVQEAPNGNEAELLGIAQRIAPA